MTSSYEKAASRGGGNKTRGEMKVSGDVCDTLLTCKICLEAFSGVPKSLACLHTFCQECLQSHLDSNTRAFKYTDYREIQCPVCRKKTPLPPGGVRKLPDNFLLVNLKEAIGDQVFPPEGKEGGGGEGTAMCDLCRHIRRRQYILATCRCLDCSKNLCPACRASHSTTRVTRAHTCVDLATAEDDGLTCSTHSQETVRFYCLTCEVCVCVVCTFEEPHASHDICAFAEGAAKHRAKIDGLLDGCRDKMRKFERHAELAQQCTQVMAGAEEQVREISQVFVQEIRQREREMIREIRENYGEETMEYLKHRDELSESFDTLSKAITQADEVTDKQLEFLLLKSELEEKLGSLGSMEVKEPPQNLGKRIAFRKGQVDLGRLKEMRADSEASSRRSSMLDLTSAGCRETADTGTSMDSLVETKTCATQVELRKRVSFREPDPVSAITSIPHREEAILNGELSCDDDEEDKDVGCQYPPPEHKLIRITPNQGCAVLPNGDLVVIDGDDNRLAILDKRGRFKYTFGSEQLSGGNQSGSEDVKVQKLFPTGSGGMSGGEGGVVSIYTPHGHTLTVSEKQRDIIISPPVGKQVTPMSRQDLFHH